METFYGDPMTQKQRDLLTELIYERLGSDERERWLAELNSGLSKFDASELISSFLMEKRQ